jgi:hypothetical protein
MKTFDFIDCSLYIHLSLLLACLNEVENALGFYGFGSRSPIQTAFDGIGSYSWPMALQGCSSSSITKHIDPYS